MISNFWRTLVQTTANKYKINTTANRYGHAVVFFRWLFSCLCGVNIEQVFYRQEDDLCQLFFYPCFSILGNDKQGIGFFGVEAFVSDMIAVFADEE